MSNRKLKEAEKKDYKFWNTQPVVPLGKHSRR
jgi:hypothetical protein